MAKVTSKLQVTIPKRIAEQYGIVPGDDVEFVPSGEGIRLVRPGTASGRQLSVAERLRLFDAATARQREREAGMTRPEEAPERDWSRDELYVRGKAR